MYFIYIHVCIHCVYINTDAPNVDDDNVDDDNDDNAETIIGGAVGGILFLILISFSVTIAVLWWRTKKRQNVDAGKI